MDKILGYTHIDVLEEDRDILVSKPFLKNWEILGVKIPFFKSPNPKVFEELIDEAKVKAHQGGGSNIISTQIFMSENNHLTLKGKLVNILAKDEVLQGPPNISAHEIPYVDKDEIPIYVVDDKVERKKF